MPTFNVSELRFTVRGQEFVKDLESWTSDMLARAAAHGLKQMVGDAAAGKTGDEATKAIESAYARVNEWASEEARSRLPAEESLFVAETKLYLRARGVASKITAETKTRADAAFEIGEYIRAAGKAKGLDAPAIDAAIDARIKAILTVVATRLAAAREVDTL